MVMARSYFPVLSLNPANPESLATIGTLRRLFRRYYGGTTETLKMVFDNGFPRDRRGHFRGSTYTGYCIGYASTLEVQEILDWLARGTRTQLVRGVTWIRLLQCSALLNRTFDALWRPRALDAGRSEIRRLLSESELISEAK